MQEGGSLWEWLQSNWNLFKTESKKHFNWECVSMVVSALCQHPLDVGIDIGINSGLHEHASPSKNTSLLWAGYRQNLDN